MKQVYKSKKIALNTSSLLVYQFLSIISGFILPYLFLKNYGSEVYGLMTSITQFLSLITLCELGIGAVIQSNLYAPLVNQDWKMVDKIVTSSDRFFKKLAIALILYVGILICLSPFITKGRFNVIYTISFIIILAIEAFTQYYFGMTNKLLLDADQLTYIQIFPSIIALIISTTTSIVLIHYNYPIQVIKLLSVLIFLIKPIYMARYVNKNYNLNRSVRLSSEPIKQKWNGVSQHIAAVVLKNTDIAILTLFSTLSNVAVYSVYRLVLNGVELALESISYSMTATLGHMISQKDKNLRFFFSKFEIILHILVVIIFTNTFILIPSFIAIYTKGVGGNYQFPIFSLLIILAEAIYCTRLPYHLLIKAAGKYKETQNSALIEAGLNLLCSSFLVFHFGLTGVAIGTLLAMLYRLFYYICFLSKNIIYRSVYEFIWLVIIDLTVVAAIILTVGEVQLYSLTYFYWLIQAVRVFIISIVISLVLFYIFCKNKLRKLK